MNHVLYGTMSFIEYWRFKCKK